MRGVGVCGDAALEGGEVNAKVGDGGCVGFLWNLWRYIGGGLRSIICVWKWYLSEEIVELLVAFEEWIGVLRGAGWRWVGGGAVVGQRKRHDRDVNRLELE